MHDPRPNRRALLAGLTAAGLSLTLLPRLAAAQDSTPVAEVVAIDHAALPLKQEGKLIVHADQPLYEPWFIDNDPTNGEGFESALVYALAEQLGFAPEDVEWGYTAFNASYAPGPKDFDFYLTEVSITEPRKQAVAFSDGYYSTPFVIIAPDDSPVKEARTLADLRQYKFGTLVNSSYATYIMDVIKPEQELLVFNTDAEAIQALANGQTAPAGRYLMTAAIESRSGDTALSTYVASKVSSVTLSGNGSGTQLRTDTGANVSLSQIKAVM